MAGDLCSAFRRQLRQGVPKLWFSFSVEVQTAPFQQPVWIARQSQRLRSSNLDQVAVTDRIAIRDLDEVAPP